MKPKYTLEKNIKVGIWENCTMTARGYDDKIIVIEPYVRWMGNNGSLAEAKRSIRNRDTINHVNREMVDNCIDSAWDIIEQSIRRY